MVASPTALSKIESIHPRYDTGVPRQSNPQVAFDKLGPVRLHLLRSGLNVDLGPRYRLQLFQLIRSVLLGGFRLILLYAGSVRSMKGDRTDLVSSGLAIVRDLVMLKCADWRHERSNSDELPMAPIEEGKDNGGRCQWMKRPSS
jgi:hypothetical protein